MFQSNSSELPFCTMPTCQHVEAATGPLVSIYAVGVYVTDQDPIVVVVQVIPTQHVELPLDSSHGVIHSPLQHWAAAQPLILERETACLSTAQRHTYIGRAINSSTALVSSYPWSGITSASTCSVHMLDMCVGYNTE